MTSPPKSIFSRRAVASNVWLHQSTGGSAPLTSTHKYTYKVLENEEAVGRAMFDELVSYSEEKNGDIVIVLLGGRGAQAMYHLIRDLSVGTSIDDLLARLHVFTQDALAPMRMENGFSFVRDFERLLGPIFFSKIKSFTPMRTDASDLEEKLREYADALVSLGGIDIFFLGFGPEAESASHLCYIKPYSGAAPTDFAGIIPISASILDHHISKFRAGGSDISSLDEIECRKLTHILTLGPAAILSAKRIVQSIVDASTAPAKPACFSRLIKTQLSSDPGELVRQVDENPGLWIRLHNDVRAFVLPDLLEA